MAKLAATTDCRPLYDSHAQYCFGAMVCAEHRIAVEQYRPQTGQWKCLTSLIARTGADEGNERHKGRFPIALAFRDVAIYSDTWQQENRMDQRTARVGKNNRAQIVTIPLEYRFPEGMKEVFIRKVGDEIVLSPRPKDWSRFLADAIPVSEDFMADVEDLPLQQPDTA